MKRVAIVYQFWPHYREPFLRALAADPRFEATVFGDTTDRRSSASISVANIPDGVRFVPTRTWYPRGAWMWQSGMLRLGLVGRYDAIVYLGDPHYPMTALSCWLARRRGVHTLMWTHGWTRKPTGGRVDRFRSKFYALADDLLLYGPRAKGFGIGAGFEPGRLHVIYNSLEVEDQLRLRSELSGMDAADFRAEAYGSPAPSLLYVGRITERKRVDLLVRAAARMERHEPTVAMVGEGPAQESVVELAKELGVRLVATGPLYDEAELAKHFMAASCCVAPGHIGLLTLHSLAYGTPVVTHDDLDHHAPEVEAIIDETAGRFFRRDDLEDMVRTLEETLDAPAPNRDLVAGQVFERYSPQNQVDVLWDVISRR